MTDSKLELVISLLKDNRIEEARFRLFEAELEASDNPEAHRKHIGAFRILNEAIQKAFKTRKFT